MLDRLVKAAVLEVFGQRLPADRHQAVVDEFEDGATFHAGDDVAAADYVDALAGLPALRAAAVPLAGEESPAALASAAELVLEGLHLSRRLNKDPAPAGAVYLAR